MASLKHPVQPSLFRSSAKLWTKNLLLLVKKYGSYSSIPYKVKKTALSPLSRQEFRKPLNASSHGKCVYCDIILGCEARSWDLDHWIPKSIYPNVGFSWKNLLPSCSYCNGKKLAHDTLAEKILHPYKDDFSDHFMYLGMSPHPKKNSSKFDETKKTIEVLHLDRTSLLKKRLPIYESLLKTRQSIEDNLIEFNKATSAKKRAAILVILNNTARDLEKTTQPSRELSSFVKSVIQDDNVFIKLYNIISAS